MHTPGEGVVEAPAIVVLMQLINDGGTEEKLEKQWRETL
jgi:hypothetical protein